MIMPLLLNVLRNADGPDYRKLRVKATECAGLISRRRDGSFLIRAGQHLHLASVRVERLANASSIPSTSFSSHLVAVGFVGTHKCIP